MKVRNTKSKCACYADGIGICLCIIFMSLGVIGITTVELSKNGNIQDNSDMGSMAGMITTSNNVYTQNVVISFFSGFWGEVILVLSFISMNIGLWFSNNKRVVVISIVGSIILYVSMYAYYSIPLEIIGLIILVFSFIAGFNYSIAKIIKLT